MIFPFKCNLNLKRITHTIPEPHLSQTESFSVVPTEEAIFVVGAFTLLNPEGLSESPVEIFKKERLQLQKWYIQLLMVYRTSMCKVQKVRYQSQESPAELWTMPTAVEAHMTLGSHSAFYTPLSRQRMMVSAGQVWKDLDWNREKLCNLPFVIKNHSH